MYIFLFSILCVFFFSLWISNILIDWMDRLLVPAVFYFLGCQNDLILCAKFISDSSIDLHLRRQHYQNCLNALPFLSTADNGLLLLA